MERKKLKIYIPGIKFPSQDRRVSPPTSLLTPFLRTGGSAPHKLGNAVSQTIPSFLNTGGALLPATF
ncbi:hypothetical protein A0127_05435 [Thermococcus peptonophilus]|uniref:Uncharacterized protein n=1 Tax=Thermococcus peptonophilus TaxID=53952 RepID=A0A142CV46_9EURY|nr:hypothetical protein A0127_05435 [Thermococcus peptonophilus]